MRMCVPVGGRNFFFPTLKQNPRLPTDVGMPGLLYRANVEPEWKGIVQTVFVGLRGAEYKYVGEYRLTLGERLSVDEYRALAAPVSVHVRRNDQEIVMSMWTGSDGALLSRCGASGRTAW